ERLPAGAAVAGPGGLPVSGRAVRRPDPQRRAPPRPGGLAVIARSWASVCALALAGLPACAVLPVGGGPGVALPALGSAGQQPGRMPAPAQAPLATRPRQALDRLSGSSSAWAVCDFRYRIPRAAPERLESLRAALPSLAVAAELPADLRAGALPAAALQGLPP